MAETITRERVDEMFRVVFQGLSQLGGRARPKDLFAKIEPKLRLTEHERGTRVHRENQLTAIALIRRAAIFPSR
jgi:hypothetical protein